MLLELFSSRFSSLGGYVGVVSNAEEASIFASRFLAERGASSVFVSDLPPQINEALLRELRRRGFAVHTKNSEKEALKVIKQVDASITAASCAVAETGTLVEVVHDDADRLLSSLPKTHLCFVKRSTIYRTVYDVTSILRMAFEQRTAAVTFISGPSRSGDIEQRLMLGIHGPHHVCAVVMNWL